MSEPVRRIDSHCGEIHFDRDREDGAFAELTSEGFLRVDARPARTGVQIYSDGEGKRWGELRTEAEVFHVESLKSFDLAVLTDNHPDDFVSAETVKEVQIGHSGTGARQDGRFVRTSVLITDAESIARAKAGKLELSCGYHAQVIPDSGVTDSGEAFSGRQTQIRINHIAIVDRGRAGPECKLIVGRGDAFSILTEAPMADNEDKTVAIKVDGAEFQVSPELAAAYAKQDTPEPAQLTLTPPDNSAELAAKYDALKAESDARAAAEQERADSEAARIDARVCLVTDAREVLDAREITQGMSDGDIMSAVIVKVQPTRKDQLGPQVKKNGTGYLVATFEESMRLHRARGTHANDAGVLAFTAQVGAVEDVGVSLPTWDDVEKARLEYINGPSAGSEVN